MVIDINSKERRYTICLENLSGGGYNGRIYERIADIVNARRNAKSKMEKVYARDKYFNNIAADPGYVLTPEQEKEINDFWGRYSFAYKNDPNTQRIFSGISGKFDPTYVGFGLQYYYLNRYWNNITVAMIRNKNFLDLTFPNAKQPKVIVRNMWARYYTPDRKLINLNEAVQLVYDELQKPSVEDLILKPDDGELGKGIVFLDKGYTPEMIKQAFIDARERFLVQEVIKNHPTYAAPHSESLNTLRIVTLFIKNKVRLVGTVWKMGRNERVDNLAAGGISCAVNEDGICADYAVDDYGNRYEKHPGGFEFAGHQLYNCKAAIDMAISLHYTLPQIKYVSWDIAINEDGEPVLIEFNSCGGSEMPQMNGWLMYIDKDTLKDILDVYLLEKFYYDRVSWKWNYREYHDHAEIVKYGGTARRIEIPRTLSGKLVTKIEATAFRGTDMKKIIMFDTAKITGKGEFVGISPECKIVITQTEEKK